jgi:hypothetical protein
VRIKAKFEYIIRILGMVNLFISLLFSLISDYFMITNLLLYLIYISIVILWFTFFILLKFEIEFIINEIKRYLFLLTFISFIIVILSISLIIMQIDSIQVGYYLSQLISVLMLLLCWNYSLTIIKRKKYIFFLSGLIYSLLTIIFKIIIFNNFRDFITVFSFFCALSGILFILIAEAIMVKKGLLKYI